MPLLRCTRESRAVATAAPEAEAGDGEGKVTPLGLFSAGVIELGADLRALIRAAA